MMFGNKALIEQYERRISDLQAQIAMLHKLVLPQNSQGLIPLIQLEQDAIMSGQDELILVKDADSAEEINSEASRLLSGQYE